MAGARTSVSPMCRAKRHCSKSGIPLATGLHQVDNPVFDREGNLYVTYSGTRGQEVPVSIFRVGPNGRRESYVSGIVNPTSMTFDAAGQLYVSSRFEGSIYRVFPNGTHEPYATDLGIACGMAFDRNGVLYVGDRSGTVFAVQRDRTVKAIATLPRASRHFTSRSGPTTACTCRRRRSGPTTTCIGSTRRPAPSTRVLGIRAAAGNCVRLAGSAVCHRGAGGMERPVSRAVRRQRPRLSSRVSRSWAWLSIRTAASSSTSNDTAYRLDVPIRPLDCRTSQIRNLKSRI